MMTPPGAKIYSIDRAQYPFAIFANFVKISFAHTFGCAGVPKIRRKIWRKG